MTITFNEYQEWTATTRVYPGPTKVIYPALGLSGESGEVAEKVKKLLRDHDGILSDEYRGEIAKEIGDVLWYCAALSADLGYELGEIAQMNIDKLMKRKAENKIQGNGDNR